MSLHTRVAQLALGTTLLAAATTAAPAQTIAFDGVPGGVQPPYAGHAELGYTVMPTAGAWFVGNFFGNPVPSIFARANVGTGSATVCVDRGGALFNFLSADMSSNLAPGTAYEIIGTNGLVVAFTDVGVLGAPTPSTFETILGSAPGVAIDALFITMSAPPAVGTFNLDNIVVRAAAAPTAVPEPRAALLLAAGALGLGAVTRVRRRSRSAG